jgi:hypothetical protein
MNDSPVLGDAVQMMRDLIARLGAFQVFITYLAGGDHACAAQRWGARLSAPRSWPAATPARSAPVGEVSLSSSPLRRASALQPCGVGGKRNR